MSHSTIQRGYIRTGVLATFGGLGLVLTGCEPAQPVMEIKAPGVEIQVDRPAEGDQKGDVKIDVQRPKNPDEIKIDVEKPAATDDTEPKS